MRVWIYLAMWSVAWSSACGDDDSVDPQNDAGATTTDSGVGLDGGSTADGRTALFDASPGVDGATGFCALVRCAAGFACCEEARACLPDDSACPPRGDSGIRRPDAGNPCAVILCPANQRCCPATGMCYDPRCLSCCMMRF